MASPVSGSLTTVAFPCDLCGSDDPVEVPHARDYTQGRPVHICRNCGFVYVRERREAEEIAASWTEDIFGAGYTARIPAVTARLTFVAESLDDWVGLRDKDVCEIGAGEGEFLELARARGARPFGIEPSPANCALMESADIPCFTGTIEAYEAAGESSERFDVVAILWTLENCQDCRRMLRAAHALLRPGGHVVVATGSRILVPFKKPLWTYFGSNPTDTHAFRFSANTLQGLLAVSELPTVHVNRYLDHDVLCVVGRKGDPAAEWSGDDYLDVHSFFERWHVDTAMYFPAPAAPV
jgi:2-polyprenyl-3-methyl-5-hydroxy-6-metoxy-1,4-benzoquinol methylase